MQKEYTYTVDGLISRAGGGVYPGGLSIGNITVREELMNNTTHI